MSNYLNHLVTRSLNPSETSVQPRLPSLFEPVVGMPALGTVTVNSGEPGGIAEVEATQRREVTSSQGPTHAENVPSMSRRSLFSSRIEHPSVPVRPMVNVDELGFTPPVHAIPELPTPPHFPTPDPNQARDQPAHQVPKSAQAIDAVEQQPAIVQQPIIQRIVGQLFSAQSDNLDPGKTPVTARVRPAERPAAITPKPPTTTLPPSPPMSVQHVPTAIVKPQIAPLIQPLPIPAVVSQESSQPAPTIQVTIGRIEVRATAPATQPLAQSRPKSPVMSLDEYLRQQGARR